MKSAGNTTLAFRSLSLFAVALALAIQPLSAHARSFTTLYSFTGAVSSGDYPSSPLLRDPEGNLYGIALGGTFGQGIIFKVSNTGDETVLYNFSGTDGDGDVPDSMSFRDSAGNLFGTTFQGGAYSFGTIFKLDPQGNETIVYNFCPQTPCINGAYPGGVVRGKNGSLYGITYAGGDYSCDLTGCGTVFEINRKGVQTFVHAFSGLDGEGPNAGLVLDESGNVYGATTYGGAYGFGTVFIVTPTGQESVEYSFDGGANGAYPQGGLYRDAEGNLYGTTSQGGAYNYGAIFKISATGQYTVLYSFPGGESGANPYAGLNLDKQGDIFGTTSSGGSHNFGIIFKLDTSGNESVLHNFGKKKDNVHASGLIIDGSGILYGTTYQGGACNNGSVFELVP